MIVAALVLAAAQPMAAALVEKYWTVENSVISPDGFPRAAIVVVETSQRTITGPFVDGMGDELAVNDRVEFSGRSGSVPGPTLTVRQGDTVKVHVTNRLHSEQVTVHWHGLHMRKQAFQDGTLGVTQCGIVPGATQLYEFTITQMPGTHWYHSHVSSQTMDGLQGMIVVLPAEGQTDPIMAAYNYAHDEQLVVSDWAHDVAADLDTRYLTRIGTYEQKLPHEWWQTGPGTEEAVTTIFKPDYPWPSYAVLLNGRGQTDCRVVTEADCERVRAVGWPHFLNSSIPPYYGDAPPLPRIDGNLQRTYGQCMPARPPFLGCVRYQRAARDRPVHRGAADPPPAAQLRLRDGAARVDRAAHLHRRGAGRAGGRTERAALAHRHRHRPALRPDRRLRADGDAAAQLQDLCDGGAR